MSLSFSHHYSDSALPWWPSGTESTCNTKDLGSIPELARSPGGGTGNPLQYSCLENPMDRGAWWVTVHGVTKSQTLPSNYHYYSSFSQNPERISWHMSCVMVEVGACWRKEMAKDYISYILSCKNLHYLELFVSYESSFCPLRRSLCEAEWKILIIP